MGVLFVILGLWLMLGALVALVAFMARRDPGDPVHLEELEHREEAGTSARPWGA